MIELNIDTFESDVQARFFTNEDERILIIKLSGTIRVGSEGGTDINTLFMKMTGYYFWIEPQAILIDLSSLTYTFGNSIYRIIHFLNIIARSDYEKELPIAFVVSEKNEPGLCRLLNINKGSLPKHYFHEFEKANAYLESTLEAD